MARKPQHHPLTPLQKAWLAKNIPDTFKGSYRDQYVKALVECGMRAAINSKCLDCMGFQQAEVARCPIETCPLFNLRPYQGRKRVEEGDE